MSIVALGEFSIRFLHYVRDGRPFLTLPCSTNVLQEIFSVGCDQTLGWKTPANQWQDFTSKDFAGVKHAVHYSTRPHGFRLYGDAKSRNPKIMIAGDSFTHAVDVSDDQTYYAKLKRNLSDRIPVEIFAYGTNGYGTL